MRVADAITKFAGSTLFVYVHVLVFAVWMLVVEKSPWPTLTLVVSLEAIFLSTFVMIGQNRQAAFQQDKADHDFRTNEIELKSNTELTQTVADLTQKVGRRRPRGDRRVPGRMTGVEVVRGWDGSACRTLRFPGDGRAVEVWDTARVVAGESVALCVLAVGDRGRDAFRWRPLAQRWAGAPFWGKGPPPTVALPGGEAPHPSGHGPDGAPSWATATRFLALPGSRGDRAADAALVDWALTTHGPVDVHLGHGDGARALQLHPRTGGPRVLLDGGLPLGPDADDGPLTASWTTSPPTAVLLASTAPTRYETAAALRFLQGHPRTGRRVLTDVEGHGLDHDRLVDDRWAVVAIPGLTQRALNGWRL